MNTNPDAPVWGPWLPFKNALAEARDAPGVYCVRQAATGHVIYVGMDRSVRGRLYRYSTGQGFTGLTQALFDEALHDGFMASWKPRPDSAVRASVQFMRAVLDRAELEISVAYTADRRTAIALEASTYVELLESGQPLLNKQQLRIASE